MSDSAASTASKKGRPWLRRLGIGLGACLVLLVIGYFVVTSAAFFKGVILPRAGKSMHATITVSDASLSPFSQVVLQGLKVQTTGTEPLVSAKEARLRYSLWAILGGNLRVAEVILESPTVTVVRNADGTSNLDPFTQSSTGASAQKGSPSAGGSSAASKPPQIELGKFALNNAIVRLITLHPGGRDLVEVSNLNVTLDNLKNGQTAKLAMAADLSLDTQPPAPAPRGSLQGKLESSGELALGPDLSVASFKTRGRIQLPQASGAFSEVTGSSLSFQTDLSADPAKKSAVLHSLNLSGARRETTFLQSSQSGPITLSWGSGRPTASDATLSIILTNFNFADWKGLAPALDLAGHAHGTLQLGSRQSGEKIGLALAVAVDRMGAKVGPAALTNLQFTVTANGQVTELNKVESDYRLALAEPQATSAIASVTGKLAADVVKQTADVDARAEVNLVKLLALLPQEGVSLKSGQLQLDAKVIQRDPTLNVGGTLRIQSLAGQLRNRTFQELSLATDYDVSMTNHQQVDLRRLLMTLAPTERARTNAVALDGWLDLSKPEALVGAVKLTSSALDLTPYYDLWEEFSAPPAQPTPSSQPNAKSPPPPPSGPETEPPAVALPVKLFTAELALARCYLRELILTDVHGTVRIETNRITLPPWSLALNGAPVGAQADVNLSVPGYEYELAFKGDRIPLEPIANSFSPAYRGQAKGEVLANFNLRGAGVTGPSFQKNLMGALNLSFTNAEIQLVGPRAKALLTPIALGLGYQDLFKSPLRWLGTEAKIGAGKIQLSQFDLVSPAFTAATRGEIPLAAKLTDSPIRDWPVEFGVPRSLAERLKLAPKGATNDFVLLPNFVKAVGTVGNARTKTDAVALAQFGARTIAELPGVSPEASRLLKQADNLLGGRLGGKSPAQTNNTNSGATTNPISTLPGKLGDLFKPKTK